LGLRLVSVLSAELPTVDQLLNLVRLFLVSLHAAFKSYFTWVNLQVFLFLGSALHALGVLARKVIAAIAVEHSRLIEITSAII